jgi:hypothetical protein
MNCSWLEEEDPYFLPKGLNRDWGRPEEDWDREESSQYRLELARCFSNDRAAHGERLVYQNQPNQDVL